MKANEHQVGGSHYGSAKTQHWDFCVDNWLLYLPGQVTKYISRWRKKNGAQDLEKALHYLDKMIEVHHYRSGLSPRALHLDAMRRLYELTPPEVEIFRIMVEYSQLSELIEARGLVERLAAELAPATSLGRYPPSMAGEPPK